MTKYRGIIPGTDVMAKPIGVIKQENGITQSNFFEVIAVGDKVVNKDKLKPGAIFQRRQSAVPHNLNAEIMPWPEPEDGIPPQFISEGVILYIFHKDDWKTIKDDVEKERDELIARITAERQAKTMETTGHAKLTIN